MTTADEPPAPSDSDTPPAPDTGPRRPAPEPVGTFCLVLHSHLPWLAHHGRWPVGEEWLYQAWAGSYLPLVEILERLGAEGHRDVVTVGLTPVLADQLDDPYCLAGLTAWLADWQLRAEHLAQRRDPDARRLASVEFRAATAALEQAATTWRHGGSPRWRGLADAGVVELLGGPATHPLLPLLDPRVARIALVAGLDDARTRLGREPAGIWSPECAWAPGLEELYRDCGVSHVVVDEPTLAAAGRTTSSAWLLGDSGVVAFGRDLEVTDRIWSSRTGYPGGPDYRDFHATDQAEGFHLWRVTGPTPDKAPYDPDAARRAVDRDAEDFVAAVRRRLTRIAAEQRRPGLVVAAYDTELFGHWWHEGPMFLERVLRLLPQAGVRLTTLSGAIEAGAVATGPDRRVLPPPGTWGAGKDFRLWAGDAVGELVADGTAVQKRLLAVLDSELSARRLVSRRPDLDQLVRETMLHLSGDWAFMISRNQATDYSWRRSLGHRDSVHWIADRLGEGGPSAAGAAAHAVARGGAPFARLDARALLAAAGRA
jgi:1,4-alpha-glucan branching enzyme